MLPLWNSGINGTGQTIAIVGETNINIQDVRDFRSLFGLPVNDPQIILNGPDPGIQVDETHGGTLTLPQLPGFALQIQPGSVTFSGGGRSGVVSVMPPAPCTGSGMFTPVLSIYPTAGL